MAFVQQKLTGKKKILVNAESYAHGVENGYVATDYNNKAISPHYILPLQYGSEKDTLRACLGRNWDLNKKQYGENPLGAPSEEFDNLWNKPVVFFGSQLKIEYCNDPIDLIPQNPSTVYTVGSQQTINIYCDLQTQGGGFSTPTKWTGETLAFDDQSHVWDAVKYSQKMNPQDTSNDPDAGKAGEENYGGVNSWIFLMKTGLVDEMGRSSHPVIRADKVFYDHYHEASVPFNETELLSKQPAGKMYFAKYNTFFSSRYDSVKYRQALSSGEASNMNNSLPSIYAFLKLKLNKFAAELDLSSWRNMVENIFDIGSIPGIYHIEAAENVWNANNSIYESAVTTYVEGLTEEDSEIIAQTPIISSKYLNITRNYLLESLLTLFGFLGASEEQIINSYTDEAKINPFLYGGHADVFDREIVEKIIFAKDGDIRRALYNKYYDDWTELVTNGMPPNNNHYQNGAWSPLNTADGGMKDPNGNIALLILEKAFNNIIFHQDAYSVLQEADYYKDHCPFYNEIEFSTELFAQSADYMNQMKMTEPIASRIAESYSLERRVKDLDTGLSTYPSTEEQMAAISQAGEDKSNKRTFYDLYEETEFMTIKWDHQDAPTTTAAQPTTQLAQESTKDTFDILEIIQDYIAESQALGDYHLYSSVIKNYVVNVRDGLQTELIDENIDELIKTQILAPAYATTIAEKYNQHKRTYQEIVEGKPAHAEDIMYVVRKVRLFTPWQGGSPLDETPEEEVIQNIFFPNSTKLDAIKYIDTQVKYGTASSLPAGGTYQAWKQLNTIGYRYDVYAMRLVYGAKYHYKWIPYLNDTTGAPSDAYTGETSDTTNIPSLRSYFSNTYVFGPEAGDGSPELMKKQSFAKASAPNSSTTGVYATNIRASVGEEDSILFNGLAWSQWRDHVGTDSALFGGYYQKWMATVRVFVESDVRIIADKVFSTPSMYILDSPPVPPDVNILPYRAVNNKIKIILNAGIGEHRAEPVIIDNFDKQRFDMVKQSQLTEDNKVRFASDTLTGQFQMFRTTKKPLSYKDFEYHPSLINTSGVLSATSFEDNILPNKKYYYTFRAWEQDGTLVSNPTPVYEVELIDEQGAVKPVIRTVDFDEIHQETTKEIQRYLYIAPSTLQLLFSQNLDVDSIFAEYKTAPDLWKDIFQDKLQKKRFKIRLTSKSSGRKIDFNFAFNKLFPGGQKAIYGTNLQGIHKWTIVAADED